MKDMIVSFAAGYLLGAVLVGVLIWLEQRYEWIRRDLED